MSEVWARQARDAPVPPAGVRPVPVRWRRSGGRASPGVANPFWPSVFRARTLGPELLGQFTPAQQAHRDLQHSRARQLGRAAVLTGFTALLEDADPSGYAELVALLSFPATVALVEGKPYTAILFLVGLGRVRVLLKSTIDVIREAFEWWRAAPGEGRYRDNADFRKWAIQHLALGEVRRGERIARAAEAVLDQLLGIMGLPKNPRELRARLDKLAAKGAPQKAEPRGGKVAKGAPKKKPRGAAKK